MKNVLSILLLAWFGLTCKEERGTLDPPLTFAVIGDYGFDASGPGEGNVAALVKSWRPDLIITTGDNNYPSGADSTIDRNIGKWYHTFINPYHGQYGEGATSNMFFPCLGNHDWFAPHAQPYLDYFTLPGNGRYYDFVRGPVHFFAIDSDPHEPDGVRTTSVQANWLRTHLWSSDYPWNIVYFHHPPYSSGYLGDEADSLLGPWMRWPFREWGASVVLSGHAHSYERLAVDSLCYIIDGLGGAPPTPLDTNSHEPGSVVRYNGDFGALRVIATPAWIKIEFITITGKVIDAFFMTKKIGALDRFFSESENAFEP